MAQVTAALAPVHPKLKAEATVTGDIVRIGDLVENAGIVADVPIFRAPDLGETGMVSADSVGRGRARSRAGRARYRGLREVAVTRASRTIATEDSRRPRPRLFRRVLAARCAAHAIWSGGYGEGGEGEDAGKEPSKRRPRWRKPEGAERHAAPKRTLLAQARSSMIGAGVVSRARRRQRRAISFFGRARQSGGAPRATIKPADLRRPAGRAGQSVQRRQRPHPISQGQDRARDCPTRRSARRSSR